MITENRGRRILIATDAWPPYVSGVVRTVLTTIDELRRRGHDVEVITPEEFRSVELPFYPDAAICWPDRDAVRRKIRQFDPDHIHIVLEGPIGLAVRAACLTSGRAFTTTYTTKFPQYLWQLVGLPGGITWSYLRWFHRPATRIMVATPSLERELRRHGFRNPTHRWSRGVDLSLFYPRPKRDAESSSGWARPIQLFVGRVSVEKGLEDFLQLPTPGTKVLVGDGPSREMLMTKYPEAVFPGQKAGEELAELYADADVFVFPSRTDTFGLVMVEALASGVPVAAYPVAGPIDVVTMPGAGVLHQDLHTAIKGALDTGDPAACVRLAQTFTWENATSQLLAGLADAKPRSLTFRQARTSRTTRP